VPRRDDLHKILVLGSGPIVIGQAAEFDYSGAQACKVLLEEGYEVVLVNSNPATIMTDPEFATATYVEPLLPGPVTQVIERERPDALLPTLGGQTALNLAKALHEDGTLERFEVELIGATYDAICRAEDRDLFDETMRDAGLRTPRNTIATSFAEARAALDAFGLPLIVRPAFTLGGRGGGIVRAEADLQRMVESGLSASPIGQVLIDESVLGWGEFELEVMRDGADNVVIVCSIENVDPMGVHTGDSVTVAPQQTLTDRQYQRLRDQAIAVIRAVGVETGGSNVQFAVNPATDEVMVIEMNPRVSRSSALASKATGFPIAKIAARLAVGYRLDEIPNDITRRTPASFEPVLDYAVVKWPRFAFEKFPGVDAGLSTHMKSVGEVMAIGRTFRQAFAKAMRSRELDAELDLSGDLLARLEHPSADRFDLILELLARGEAEEEIRARTGIDLWFLRQLKELGSAFDGERTYRAVDTCAAEFEAETPYFYSAWERPPVRDEITRGGRPSVMILGSGPNRIGQGIEFDYCCVHAAMTVRESGRDAVMVNCNPETVSTDYDTSDRLYFEPLTLEDVLEIVHVEKPWGVIVQYGGQTPLKLARDLEKCGVPIIGTSPDMIDMAEDRERFQQLLHRLNLMQPPNRTARTEEAAIAAAAEIGYPLVVRPSYVLGGRAMEIVHEQRDLERYMHEAVKVSNDSPVLLDRFLNDAIEVDVDAICDGSHVLIGGIMEHIEQAGVHSGDSACSLPPHSLSPSLQQELRDQTIAMARALNVVGLMNVQFAIQFDEAGKGTVFVLEVNPRASRTVPYVSKATGRPLAKIAARCMVGQTLEAQGVSGEIVPPYYSVKEAVFPFIKFPGVDTILGPEMKSTGEVMGVGETFGEAFVKSQLAAGVKLPQSGNAFVSVKNSDKPRAIEIAKMLAALGFDIVATRGTAIALTAAGITVATVNKVAEGRPHIVDMLKNDEIALVVNTVEEKRAAIQDSYQIRRAALIDQVPTYTTLAGARAAAIGMRVMGGLTPYSIQALHERLLSAKPGTTN
jgi:carbamoyl-phosphate synthase large subunit